MVTAKGDLSNLHQFKDLKTLLTGQSPCLSVYMPLYTASYAGINSSVRQNELQWKECLERLDERQNPFGSTGRALIDSIRSWDAVAPEPIGTPKQGRSIAVFRSPDIFQVLILDDDVLSRTVLGPRFYIRPLLSSIVNNRSFYLLALSRKNTRLLYCTSHSSEEIPLPPDTKTDFDTWMNQAKPDHTAIYNAMSSGAQGISGPNALAPKGADQDAKNEYLSHFFKQIDRGVNEVLKGKSEPLVLCAVENELSAYREINHYPHLLSTEVRGAANSLKSGEMHTRAQEALQLAYSIKIDEALTEWNHRVGGGASTRLKDIVTAAHDGRVLTLLISDSQEKMGSFDDATHSVKGRETGSAADEDLVNEAAVETILHSGNVLVVPHKKMPQGNALAAIYRY